jgi:hypothetical protein
MASAELSRRVEKIVGYPPMSEMDANQRREFHEALLEADGFEDLPGRWQAAIVRAEQNRPKLRDVHGDSQQRPTTPTPFIKTIASCSRRSGINAARLPRWRACGRRGINR